MATPTHQRIGIWIIAVVMIIGTIGSFAVIILANNNQKIDQAQQQKAYDDYMKQVKDQAAKNAAASKPLDGYSAEAFDPASVTELKVDTLIQGDGAAATATSTVNANYFGWTSDGKIFDSTNKNGTTTPIDFSLSQVIQGWTKGLTGVKAGSTVKLTIPTDMAYGATAAQSGQPAGPLMFIVELKSVK
jgi:peptidylprolyl isomerase